MKNSVLVSLAYNHEEQTFSVGLLAAHDLHNNNGTDVYAKIKVSNGTEIRGETTTAKNPPSCALMFRETSTSHVLESELRHTAVQISMFNGSGHSDSQQIGEVFLSSSSVGEALKHWNKFLAQPSKPSFCWHVLSHENKETVAIEIPQSLPHIDQKKLLIHRGTRDSRHRSVFVTKADADLRKYLKENKCNKAVSNVLRDIDRQRSWSDSPALPDDLIKSLTAISEQNNAILSLSLMYDDKAAILRIKIHEALRLQQHVFADQAHERLARITHRIPSHAVSYLFLRPSTPTTPLRRSKKTRMKKLEEETSFSEEIQFKAISKEEMECSTLHVNILGSSFEKKLELGQARFTIADVGLDGEEVATTVILEKPVQQNLGDVRISLLYEPEVQQLVVIVLRANNLNNSNSQDTDAQAKIWMTLDSDVILGKTYTEIIEKSSSPFFNKSLFVTVDPSKVRKVAIYISISNKKKSEDHQHLGCLKLSSASEGEVYRHWNDALASPGANIMEWHQLHTTM